MPVIVRQRNAQRAALLIHRNVQSSILLQTHVKELQCETWCSDEDVDFMRARRSGGPKLAGSVSVFEVSETGRNVRGSNHDTGACNGSEIRKQAPVNFLL